MFTDEPESVRGL